ncbi:hypothetical protein ACIQYS_01590 [Psychrobacillus sp. NPDC096426]|uniref:hypothetical protein n=1 Tax=Psychrobacillus sp. NPDC096426 TaxID=3364491 RepID=UPI0038139542
MEFIEKVKLHKEGKYDLAAELLKLAQSDMVDVQMVCTEHQAKFYDVEYEDERTEVFRRWRAKYTTKDNTPEYRIGFNLKVMLSRHSKKAKNMKWALDTGSQLEKAKFDGEDFVYSVLTSLGHHYHVDDFYKIPKSVLKEVESYLSYDSWYDFKKIYGDHVNISPSVNRAIKKLQDEISPLILDSLYEVLPKVDLSKTVEQIIGFISISVRNRTYRKLTKLLGTKVHLIKGEKYIVRTDRMKMKQTIIDKMLGVNEGKLTNNQMNFYRKLKKLIQIEIDVRNTSPFTFNADGDILNINKRYFADKLEMNESAFKHRLIRLQEKKDKDFFAKLG